MKKYTAILVLCLFSYSVIAQITSEGICIPYKKGDKWGYSDKTGKTLLPPVYDMVEPYFGKEPYFVVIKNKLAGIANRNGKIIIPVKYPFCAKSLTDYFVVANQSKKFGILNKDNEEVFPIEYDRISGIRDMFNFNEYTYLEIHKNGKVGILHRTEKGLEFLIPMKYDDIRYEMRDATFICWKGSNEPDYIAASGEQYTPISDEERNRQIMNAPIAKPTIPDGKLRTTSKTFKGKNGEMGMTTEVQVYQRKTRKYQVQSTHTIPAKFDTLYRAYYRDFIIAIKSGKKGLVSKDGEVLLATKYDKILLTRSTMDGEGKYQHKFLVLKKGKYGVVANKVINGKVKINNEVVVPIIYDAILPVRNHYTKKTPYLIVKKDDKYGVVSNITFEVIIPLNYDNLSPKKVNLFDDFALFQIKDADNNTVYLGSNGIEYFE